VRYGLSPHGGVRRLPLSGDHVHRPEVNNGNGITRTPDGRALLVVQSVTGLLVRVDPASGRARTVELGGRVLSNGDGAARGHDHRPAVRRAHHGGAVLRPAVPAERAVHHPAGPVYRGGGPALTVSRRLGGAPPVG
jgi:sugar lactone lactonase YvrE